MDEKLMVHVTYPYSWRDDYTLSFPTEEEANAFASQVKGLDAEPYTDAFAEVWIGKMTRFRKED